MDISREKLVEIWRRVMPNDEPPEVFDTLAYPDDEPRGAADGGGYALFDDVSERSDEGGAADADDCVGDALNPCGGTDIVQHGCAALRAAVERELELTALYHALARWVLAHPAAAREDTRRGSRSISRELMRLANEQFAAAKAVAGTHMLASGEYFFPAPVRCEVASLREGLRSAWALERELVTAYARLERDEFDRLRRMHSERSLELGALLGEVFG